MPDRDIGDVSAPDLVGLIDLQTAQQRGIYPVFGMFLLVLGRL